MRERSAASAFPKGILFLTVFLDFTGFGMLLPLLPFYAETFGADAFEIGALFACYSLAQAICAPLLGRLSDRFGRRPVLMVTIFVNCCALLGFAFATTLAGLFASRIVSGMSAANFSIAQAYVADVTPRVRRSAGMGLVGAALGMGFVFGPAFAGGLSYLGEVAVPLGAAVLCAINLGLVWWRLPESLPPDQRRVVGRLAAWFPLAALSRAGAGLGGLLLLFFLTIFAFSSMEATIALFAEERFGFGLTETSWLFVMIGCVLAGVQGGLVGRLVPRLGEARLVQIGLAAMTGGLVALALAPAVAGLVGASALLAVGAGLTNPSLLGLVSQLAAESDQGATLGLSRSMGALARTAGPMWGGWAFRSLGVTTPFLSGAAVLAIVLALSVPVLRRSRGSAALGESAA